MEAYNPIETINVEANSSDVSRKRKFGINVTTSAAASSVVSTVTLDTDVSATISDAASSSNSNKISHLSTTTVAAVSTPVDLPTVASASVVTDDSAAAVVNLNVTTSTIGTATEDPPTTGKLLGLKAGNNQRTCSEHTEACGLYVKVGSIVEFQNGIDRSEVAAYSVDGDRCRVGFLSTETSEAIGHLYVGRRAIITALYSSSTDKAKRLYSYRNKGVGDFEIVI
jgi:hypothetical protein